MKTEDIEILLLRPDEVCVDHDHLVQRELVVSHVKAIASEYSPSLFGLGQVSLRGDGKYYVLDAQHRCAAAMLKGMGHVRVPFQVWRGLTIQREADLFRKLNANKKRVSALSNFQTGVTAEQPENVEIARILASFGLTVGAGGADGVVAAVEALVQIYESNVRGIKIPKRQDKRKVSDLPRGHLLSRTLMILTKAWGRDRNAFDGILLRGVSALLYKHDVRVDGTRLAQLLAKHDSPARAAGKIRALKEAARVTPTAAAVQYLEGVYNRKLSEDKKLS